MTVKARDTSTPPKSTSVDVTVEVTNVEENGTVTLSASRPRIGIAIRVTSLTDIDGSVTDVSYQWERASDGDSTTAFDCTSGNLTFGKIDVRHHRPATRRWMRDDDGKCPEGNCELHRSPRDRMKRSAELSYCCAEGAQSGAEV